MAGSWNPFARVPDECPVCGEPHAACTAPSPEQGIAIPQLPERDRQGHRQFSTRTYRRPQPRPSLAEKPKL